MMINEITSKAGANPKRWRVGRGMGSGNGKTSGRGHKGAGSRAGYGGRTLNEGGALPLFRRVPIRGFSNFRFRIECQPVNLIDLEANFEDGGEVTFESLANLGLISVKGGPVKVLGNGVISKKLKVTAHTFSDAAAKKIIDAGGEVNDLSGRLVARVKERARAQRAADKAAEEVAKAKAEAAAQAQAKAEARKQGKAKAKAKPAEAAPAKAQKKKHKS